MYYIHATVGLHLLSVGHAYNKEPWIVSNSGRDIASVRPQRLQEMLSGSGETKHQPEEAPESPSTTDSGFRKSVQGNRKE